jgi:hypothetical protein
MDTMQTKQDKTPKLPRGRPVRHPSEAMCTVGCRIKTSLREAMEKWAKDATIDLSFALRRSIEIGWPMFLERNFYNLEMKTKKEYEP